MRAHLRGLTRVVRESSDQRSELAALLLERSNLVELLEKTAREVDEVGAYSVLSAANAAEVSARASSSRLLAKEAEVAAALKLETAESEREAKEASEAIQRRRADTSALASKLALLRETDSHTLRLARKDKSALIEAENYSLELAGDDAADVAAALSEKLRVEKSVGEAIAEEYKVQIADLEARRDVWKAKTAADVISIKADIETLTGERDTVHAALLVAQARYEADLAEAKTAAVSGRGRRRASSEANFSDTDHALENRITHALPLILSHLQLIFENPVDAAAKQAQLQVARVQAATAAHRFVFPLFKAVHEAMLEAAALKASKAGGDGKKKK
jgi:hypothetical protein